MNLLSKSLYLQYLQCPRLLWLSSNTPAVIPLPSVVDLHRMAEGRKVEKMAQRLFDKYQCYHDNEFEAMVAEAEKDLNNPDAGDVFFNTVAKSGRLVAEMDILHTTRDHLLNIFEVKSSSEVKDEYLHDIAFQRYVAMKSGLDMGESSIITINTDYLRQGSVDVSSVSGLFRITDVSGEVDDLMPSTEKNIHEALMIMDLPECPEPKIGKHCDDCPLADTPDGCFSHIHSEPCNPFTLYRIPKKRAWGWYEDGILKNTDIPPTYPLTDKQRIQIKAEKTEKPHIDKGAVRSFIDGLEYPLHYLDFETFSPAIPMFQHSSPYQQIPFQFSLHIQTAPEQDPKDIQHHSWIWDGNGDPRLEQLKRLEGLLGKEGSIVVYNAQFERMILRQAVKISPEHEDWLTGILDRFVDLLEPFRAFNYYHPAQHGSASIKSVLPALTGKSYEGMDISNGAMASVQFVRVMFGDGKKDRALVMRQLEEYCGLDTMGMVEIVGRLRGMTQRKLAPQKDKPTRSEPVNSGPKGRGFKSRRPDHLYF